MHERQGAVHGSACPLAGERIGMYWEASRLDVEEFLIGMDVELDHGMRNPETNVTNDDETVTAKIAHADLNEFSDQHARLAAIETDAVVYWAARRA